MTLQEKLLKLFDRLVLVTNNIYHYKRPENVQTPFIVWAEDGEDGSFHAGNRKEELRLHGTIDLFTQTEFDAMADWIQDALNGIENCGWTLQAVQYEDETGLIHYTYEWWW